MSPEKLVTVGQIGRPRGLDGELFITPATDFPDRFVGMETILVKSRDSWEEYKIEEARMVGGRPAIKFKDVDTPEQAARMTNRDLAVPMTEVVALPGDSFYHFELVGCKVDNEAGDLIGELIDVEPYPANDIFVVKTTEGKVFRIPAVKQYVLEIDITAGKVVVALAGLAEE